METVIVTAIVGAIGGLAAGTISARTALRAKGLDRLIEDRKLFVSAYDTRLLDQRLVEYKKLWKLTEPTSRIHIENLDSAKASSLAGDMTSWYYTDGGMLLSADARNTFFVARATLDADISEEWRKSVVDVFSNLRTAITEDMNSRRGPTLSSGEAVD